MSYEFETSWARWARGALGLILGLSLHGGVVALFLMKPPVEDTELSETAGAIMIELSTIAVAAPLDPLDLPIGPPAEETPAVPDSPEEQTTAKTVDGPVLDRTPYEPDDPELRFQVANPDQKESDTEHEADAPPTEVQEQPQTTAVSPVPETTAPPPVEAQQGTKTAAAEEGISKDLKKAIASWQKKLMIELVKNKRYPTKARRQGIQGQVDLWFRIDRSGRIIDKRVLDDRGRPVLGDAALAILDRAGKLPAPPSGVPGESFEFTIPIEFKIK